MSSGDGSVRSDHDENCPRRRHEACGWHSGAEDDGRWDCVTGLFREECEDVECNCSVRFSRSVREVCDEVAEMLIEKNRAYGNAALDPVRVFSKASPVEQILVRIDDKLSRLARGSAAGEDVERDLLGYLVLLRIARRRASEGKPPKGGRG